MGSPVRRADPQEAVPCAATRQQQRTSPPSPAAPEPNEHLRAVLRSWPCRLRWVRPAAKRGPSLAESPPRVSAPLRSPRLVLLGRLASSLHFNGGGRRSAKYLGFVHFFGASRRG